MFQVEISFSKKHHSEAEKTPCFPPSKAGQVDGMCQERAQKAAKVESFLADFFRRWVQWREIFESIIYWSRRDRNRTKFQQV